MTIIANLTQALNNLPRKQRFSIDPHAGITPLPKMPLPLVQLSNRYDIALNGSSDKYGKWLAVNGLSAREHYLGAIMGAEEIITELTANKLWALSQGDTHIFVIVDVVGQHGEKTGQWAILRQK